MYVHGTLLGDRENSSANNSGRMNKMQLQQQISRQQNELLQQLQLLQHQYLLHRGINLQSLFLAQQQKSEQKLTGKSRETSTNCFSAFEPT